MRKSSAGACSSENKETTRGKARGWRIKRKTTIIEGDGPGRGGKKKKKEKKKKNKERRKKEKKKRGNF